MIANMTAKRRAPTEPSPKPRLSSRWRRSPRAPPRPTQTPAPIPDAFPRHHADRRPRTRLEVRCRLYVARGECDTRDRRSGSFADARHSPIGAQHSCDGLGQRCWRSASRVTRRAPRTVPDVGSANDAPLAPEHLRSRRHRQRERDEQDEEFPRADTHGPSHPKGARWARYLSRVDPGRGRTSFGSTGD